MNSGKWEPWICNLILKIFHSHQFPIQALGSRDIFFLSGTWPPFWADTRFLVRVIACRGGMAMGLTTTPLNACRGVPPDMRVICVSESAIPEVFFWFSHFTKKRNFWIQWVWVGEHLSAIPAAMVKPTSDSEAGSFPFEISQLHLQLCA